LLEIQISCQGRKGDLEKRQKEKGKTKKGTGLWRKVAGSGGSSKKTAFAWASDFWRNPHGMPNR
jgi:hypothetical protein